MKEFLVASTEHAADMEAEEHRFCHQLLIENISILERTETYATGAVAACIAFGIAATSSSVAIGTGIAALLISVVGLVRWIGLDGVIGTLNNYLVILGTALPEGGWTAYYRANRSKYLKRSRWLIWLFLLSASGTYCAYQICFGPVARA